MSVFSHNRRQRWVAAIAASSLAFLVAACGEGSGVAGNKMATVPGPGEPIYTMIIDAGSSGTRINFYKVVAGSYPKIDLLSSQDFEDNGINDFLNGTGTIDPPEWKSKPEKKKDTGLDDGYAPAGCSMTGDTKNGGQAEVGPCVIQPLLDAMKKTMDKESVTSDKITVELFATAGMRTMEKFNGGSFTSEQIASFYDTMKKYTRSKGFVTGDFRTSNGNKEEGVWTWVNLNDQYYNAFGGNTTYHTTAPETRGDFEVGGSSMQVAFPTTTIPVGDANNVYPVSINGKTYNVFSKTYLGLGGDDTRKFVRAYGYSNAATAGYTGVDCFGSNASLGKGTEEDSGITLFNAPKLFPNSAAPAGTATGVSWPTILSTSGAGTPLVLGATGRYNFETCAAKYNEVTQAVMALPRNNNGTRYEGSASSYSDLATKIAQSSVPFVGLDNFYYTTNDLELVTEGQIKTAITEAQVKTAIATICPDNGKGPAADSNEPTLRDFGVCPNAAYMYNFLWRDTTGTGGLFDPSSKAKYDGVVPSKIEVDGKNVSVLTWSRGYLLLKYSK